MSDSPWLVCLSRCEQALERFIFFPYAAGSAADFDEFSYLLSKVSEGALEVWSVEYPGHGRRQREEPSTDFSRLVQGITAALHPLIEDRPFSFFGYSLGALVATEVAFDLQMQRALSPRHLYVAACAPPHLAREPEPIDDVEDLVAYLVQIGAQEHIDERLLARALPLFQADWLLRTSYVPKRNAVKLTCPLTAFGGCEDRDIPPSALAAWDILVETLLFSCQTLPGGHVFFHEQKALMQCVQILIRDFRDFQQHSMSVMDRDHRKRSIP